MVARDRKLEAVPPFGLGQKSTARKSKARRVQMDMPPRSVERLEALKEKLELNSYSEVMKDALKLLEFVADEEEDGSTFLVRRKDGTTQEIKILITV